MAEPVMIEDFGKGAAGWRLVTDQVMGGVSEGSAVLREEAGRAFLELSGTVSTANNGGFIQARFDLPEGLPETAQSLKIRVKGNGQSYFIHLRQRGASRPWHYYQAPFEAGEDWQEITLPFHAFRPSRDGLGTKIAPSEVQSIALVAYGRDHEARVALDYIEFE
ncbi:MAG: CIA30 family protein [Pseudomonadota bacterium]